MGHYGFLSVVRVLLSALGGEKDAVMECFGNNTGVWGMLSNLYLEKANVG